RIRGGFKKQDNPFATYSATVGDVARYWHGALFSTTIPIGLRDAPGIQVNKLVTVISNVQNGSTTNEPNQGAQSSNPATSGQSIADSLFTKNFASPDADAVPGTPPGFNTSDQGYLPTSPVLEFSTGVYAAFTQAGTHRITVQDGITGATKGRQAQDAG